MSARNLLQIREFKIIANKIANDDLQANIPNFALL